MAGLFKTAPPFLIKTLYLVMLSVPPSSANILSKGSLWFFGFGAGCQGGLKGFSGQKGTVDVIFRKASKDL